MRRTRGITCSAIRASDRNTSRVKTSQKDELKDVDEAGGLMARDCPIRYIITKQALQEGWDCAFAYVLAILSNPNSRSALTQLVGRILRQPSAQKTRVPALDESYVFCFQRPRQGTPERDTQGLRARRSCRASKDASPWTARAQGRSGLALHRQRPELRNSARNLVLPAFMIRDDGGEAENGWRLVYYEADILSRIPWGEVDVTPLYDLSLEKGERGGLELRAGLDANVELAHVREGISASGDIDYYFAASHLLDAMPNPWRGHELARKVFGALLGRHPREQVVANYILVLEEMRKRLESERGPPGAARVRRAARRRRHALHGGHRRDGLQPTAGSRRVARETRGRPTATTARRSCAASSSAPAKTT